MFSPGSIHFPEQVRMKATTAAGMAEVVAVSIIAMAAHSAPIRLAGRAGNASQIAV